MFPTQNPAFPKHPVPTCGPPSLLGGNKGFPHHFIDTGAYNKVVFIDILGFKWKSQCGPFP